MSRFSFGQIVQLVNSMEGNGYTADHLTKFGQLGENHNLFLAFLDGRAEIKINTILQFLSEVAIPATQRFVAKDKFVVNTKRNAPVKISYLGDNFTAWFLNGEGKIEDPISEQTLRYHKLRQSSVDGSIIAELGGEAKAETTLSEMFSLMEKQKNGEDGCLLNNGYANIFYIKDQAFVLRTVYAYWNDGGWNVYARPVDYPISWNPCLYVFSRNPLETLTLSKF